MTVKQIKKIGIKTFDVHFCFEFAVRTMSHQNTTFDFQSFYFEVCDESEWAIIWPGILIIKTR